MNLAQLPYPYVAFAGDRALAQGDLPSVAIAVSRAMAGGETRPIVVLDAGNSEVVDLDLRGSESEIAARVAGGLARADERIGSRAGTRDRAGTTATRRGLARGVVVASALGLAPDAARRGLGDVATTGGRGASSQRRARSLRGRAGSGGSLPARDGRRPAALRGRAACVLRGTGGRRDDARPELAGRHPRASRRAAAALSRGAVVVSAAAPGTEAGKLTEGPISRHVIAMAAPIAIGMVFQTLYYLVDLYFVGRLGDAAIAGVSTAGNVTFLVIALTQVLAVGTVALVAQAIGRRDRADANLVFNQSLSIAATFTIGSLLLGYLFTPAYMHALGADARHGGGRHQLPAVVPAGTGDAVPGSVDGRRTARHRHRQAGDPRADPHGRAQCDARAGADRRLGHRQAARRRGRRSREHHRHRRRRRDAVVLLSSPRARRGVRRGTRTAARRGVAAHPAHRHAGGPRVRDDVRHPRPRSTRRFGSSAPRRRRGSASAIASTRRCSCQ